MNEIQLGPSVLVGRVCLCVCATRALLKNIKEYSHCVVVVVVVVVDDDGDIGAGAVRQQNPLPEGECSIPTSRSQR